MNKTIQILYEKYFSAVYKYFCKKTNQDDAEDLAQQTFLKLITYISCIDKIHSPKSLVFTVAKSVLSDYYRNKKTIEIAISFDELCDYTDNYDFTDEIESTDFLNKLTKREHQIVDLKVQGYTSKEIGEKLGVSGSTVRTYLENIRKKIR
ncbi:MAG: sigma-70 family RNA polymerase sigma factor [Clostridia bacterium]|nr:sigma-70 family RNA polymerase sigma factor [Clostridia bacterium]